MNRAQPDLFISVTILGTEGHLILCLVPVGIFHPFLAGFVWPPVLSGGKYLPGMEPKHLRPPSNKGGAKAQDLLETAFPWAETSKGLGALLKNRQCSNTLGSHRDMKEVMSTCSLLLGQEQELQPVRPMCPEKAQHQHLPFRQKKKLQLCYK